MAHTLAIRRFINLTEAAKEKTAMINVFWDNGTLSYHGASALTAAK